MQFALVFLAALAAGTPALGQVLTLDDPLPCFGLCVGGIARLMSPKVRAAKLIKADHRP